MWRFVQLTERVDFVEVGYVFLAVERWGRRRTELAGAPEHERRDLGRLREPGWGGWCRHQLVLAGTGAGSEHGGRGGRAIVCARGQDGLRHLLAEQQASFHMLTCAKLSQGRLEERLHRRLLAGKQRIECGARCGRRGRVSRGAARTVKVDDEGFAPPEDAVDRVVNSDLCDRQSTRRVDRGGLGARRDQDLL